MDFPSVEMAAGIEAGGVDLELTASDLDDVCTFRREEVEREWGFAIDVDAWADAFVGTWFRLGGALV